MQVGSDLVFPDYGDGSLGDLRASGEAVSWTRAKPPFWQGVSGERLFVGAVSRHDLVIKDLTDALGVAASTWNTDWMRLVEVDGCKLGNLVKLDGDRGAAHHADATRDAKRTPRAAASTPTSHATAPPTATYAYDPLQSASTSTAAKTTRSFDPCHYFVCRRGAWLGPVPTGTRRPCICSTLGSSCGKF